MSGTAKNSDVTTRGPNAEMVDMTLEVVAVPVSDIERAKRFYGGLGWRLDADFTIGDNFRGVQMTPPGSQCSIHFGKGVTPAAPGSAQGLILIVDDIEAARAELVRKGVDASETFHYGEVRDRRLPGPDPERRSYRSWVSFKDPDGNGWLLQEIKTRLPGRGFGRDLATFTALLREAETHHGAYEASSPKHHWSDWYGAYIVARERGRTAEEAFKDASLHVDRVR